MPERKQPNGCRKMLRRTFLFLIGLALAKVLTEFFSIAQNRSKFINFVGQLWEKAIALWKKSQQDVTQQPIPQAIATSAPLPSSTPTPKPKPTSTAKPTPTPNLKGKPVKVTKKTVAGVSFYQTTIDLSDPEIFLTIGLANNATYANTQTATTGDEPFGKLVARQKAAVVANGTFFSKNDKKVVMGNMVAGGKFLKYSRWENYGTTLGIKAGNQLEMITARSQGKPNWDQHWFSLTCGPRLIRDGKIWLSPLSEGFSDPNVLNKGYRTAIGFPANRKQLFLISFLASLTLQQEAEIMKSIGCVEAMNLDGGASEALAHNGKILLPAGRNLTNVIVVYDTNYPAPSALKTSWQRFQDGERPYIPG